RRRALDGRRVARTVEFHQPQKMREDARASALADRDHALDGLPDTVLVEQAVHQTSAVQTCGLAFGLFGRLHRHTAICFDVSSARLRWSSADKILPVTMAVACTTNLPTSRLSSASIRSWSCCAASRALAMICSAAVTAFLVSSRSRRAAAA